MDPVKIVGADGNRRKNDFYPTPKECVVAIEKFLCPEYLERGMTIWEPACGQGHIVNVLRERGHKVIGSDIQTGTDFITTFPPRDVDFIITNPPFSLAEKFIRHTNEMKIPTAFLLKSQYWHSAKRLTLYTEAPPDFVLPLTWRPDFTGQGNSLMDMIWCVWLHKGNRNRSIYFPLKKPDKED